MTERTVLDVRSADEWQAWLADNHEAAAEIWLRLFNKNAPEPGISYNDAVEVALCFGCVERLIESGRMRDAGQRQIDVAKADGRWPV